MFGYNTFVNCKMAEKKPEQKERKKQSKKKNKKKKYQKKPEQHRTIAKERIAILFEQAAAMFSENKSLSNRYVTLARKIAMKYKVRMSSEFRRMFCKHCYKFLVPGKNLRVRLGEGKLIYYCLECKKFWRMPIGRKARNGKMKNEKRDGEKKKK